MNEGAGMELQDDPAGADADQECGRQKLTAAFARLSRTYEMILHAAGEGIVSLDPEGRIAFANSAATRLLGWPMEELPGLPLCAVVHACGCGVAACPLAAPAGAERTGCRDVFITRTGEGVAVEYNLARIRDEGSVVGAVLIFNDIGERERAEKALQKSLAALRESNERLATTRDQLMQAEKLAAIGQFAAGMVHEISTPLGYIGSNVTSMWHQMKSLLALVDAYEQLEAGADQSLTSAVAAARQRCDLEFLRQDAPALLAETAAGLARVAGLMRELRGFASAGGSCEWQWREPAELLDTAAEAAAERSGGAAIRVEREYARVPSIYCQATPLSQALVGLVQNALQAVDRAGRVVLRVRSGAAGGVVMEIEDDGAGIAAEILPRVRDPFFTTRPAGAGIGMGLTLADATVRRHGGCIEIASQAGSGTRVAVSLPRRPEAL